MREPFYTNAEHLTAEMRWLNVLLRAESARMASDAPGVYMSRGEAERLLNELEAASCTNPGQAAEAAAYRAEIDARVNLSLGQGVALPLARLAKMYGLSPLEYGACVMALAPEWDIRYERVFGYLHDDLSRRRPTVDLALRLLCGSTEQRLAARGLFTSESLLFAESILVDAGGGPSLGRPLVTDELTLAFLLDVPGLPAHIAPFVERAVSALAPGALRWPEHWTRGLSQALLHQTGRRDSPGHGIVLHLDGPEGTGRTALAASLCAELSVPLFVVSLRELARADGIVENLRLLLRYARFMESALFLEDFDVVVHEEGKAAGTLAAVERLLKRLSWIVFAATERGWSPRYGPLISRVHSLALPYPDTKARETLWQSFSAEFATGFNGVESTTLASRFRLTPGQIRSAIASAQAKARTREQPVSLPDVAEACHTVSNRRLGHLARRLKPRRSWPDITVPASTLAQLREICNQVRRRACVYEQWGFERRMSLGKGLCALFYGPSGAGKTMAVEIIAAELMLDAYKIDLATVVSKYIGETEKNLNRIFEEAENTSALLFFDEADALFGKRSEVKDAHDRYANIEINFLLQRVEEYDGLVILASNLRKHIDEGFFRRMQFAIEFPLPEASDRYRIWKQHLPPEAPVAGDVDFDFLASRFAIAGGNIKNIVLNAAFLAADGAGEISMQHFLRATRREFQKMGQVCADTDFAPYQSLIRNA